MLDPPLPLGLTVGGPSGGEAPRAIVGARAVSPVDFVEIALVAGAWIRVGTISLADLGVEAAGTASLDAGGGRIVFIGRLVGDLEEQVLTATRDTIEGVFSVATPLHRDLGGSTLADPWLDDDCQYLYVSNYSTTTVVRMMISP